MRLKASSSFALSANVQERGDVLDVGLLEEAQAAEQLERESGGASSPICNSIEWKWAR